MAERRPLLRPALGLALIATTLATILFEWHVHPAFGPISAALVLLVLALAAPLVNWSRAAFLAAGLVLALLTLLLRDDWQEVLLIGVERGAFIAAFFTALATLRIPARVSPAIERCGIYLTEQPPGRRYAALTAGGHIFALILNYGAITLLGTLVEMTTARETNEEIKRIRIRRMLLAIQRGFVSSLCWSPLGFSMAISVTVVPGASWSGAVALAAVSSAILAGSGWALDTIFKPRITGPRPVRKAPTGSWRDLRPLLLLLLILGTCVAALEVLTGLRIIAVVMLVVPVMSLAWLYLQGRDTAGGGLARLGREGRSFAMREMPSYSSEIVLLVMAGFIGAIGGELLTPLLDGGAVDMGAVPLSLLLVGIVWFLPLAGQVGMNPILAVSLVAPLFAGASASGISPNIIVVAITAGWALAGATSPYTATVLLIAKMGGVKPYAVGWRWNGLFTLVAGGLLSLWVVTLAQL